MAKKTALISRQIKKKPVAVKTTVVEDNGSLMQSSQAVVLTEYRGLTVTQISDLRKKLAESDTTFTVVKNTLFKRASADFVEADPRLDATLAGPTAVAYAGKDAVASTKALIEYIASNRNTPLKIKGGIVGGKFYTPEMIDALSKVPPREVLISQMLGSFNAPITGLVGTLNGIISNFVFTLQAVADKRQAEG